MNNVYYERPDQSKTAQADASNDAAMQYKKKDERIKKTTSSPKDLIINIILIVLSILLVILLITSITILRESEYTYVTDENTFWYTINDGQYSNLSAHVYHNQNENVELTDGLEQCYAIARYFEAASLYKAAVCVQDREDMERYLTIMEECVSYMQDVPQVLADINEKLGIENVDYK